MSADDSYLFEFTGVWHVTHADGTTEDIELAHGNLVEDLKGTVGQFILSGPAPQPLRLDADWTPTAETLASLDEAIKNPSSRVLLLPEQGVSKVALRSALALYFDVDADDPRTDGAERELADAIRALERIKTLVEES
jgi:hypothetical protein